MKPESIHGISRTTQPTIAESTGPKSAAKVAPRTVPEAIAAPTAEQRAQLGSAPASYGRLDLKDPRAQAAIADSLGFLCGRGIGDAPLAAKAVDIDELGITHVRFDRVLDGVKVFGEQVVTHAKDGKVEGVTDGCGKIQRSLAEPKAVVSKDQALTLARAAFDGKPQGLPVVERTIFKDDAGVYRKGFHVVLTSLELPNPKRMHYLIDAGSPADKAVKAQWNEIDEMSLAARSTRARKPRRGQEPEQAANANTLYSGKVEIKTSKDGRGNYILKDTTRSQGVETRDAMNADPPGISSSSDSSSGPISFDSSAPVTDNNDIWGESGDSERQQGAIDAHFGMEMTHDMYRDLLGVDSFDLKGGKMLGIVHVGNGYDNAFWDSEKMNYGDGDGQRFSFLTTLDITGHEITHGLVQNTCGLVYRHQSGGLNEGCADIGGFLNEYYAAKKTGRKWNYSVGEDCFMPGSNPDHAKAARYMDDPTKDGRSIDNFSKYTDKLNVHLTSGIINNFWYQVTEQNADGQKKANSVSHQRVENGIGVENAAKIFIRAMRFYMTPNCTFPQCRQAWIKAATDLFPKDATVIDTVKKAWAVVGVDGMHEGPAQGPSDDEESPWGNWRTAL